MAPSDRDCILDSDTDAGAETLFSSAIAPIPVRKATGVSGGVNAAPFLGEDSGIALVRKPDDDGGGRDI